MKMIKSQYDAIITNIAGTCPYENEGEVFKDAMIEISGNATNRFTYAGIKKMEQAIEAAIDYLNQEKENLIDREKIGTYERIQAPTIKKKKVTAIKYADLEVGGVYLDEKRKKWIFLGKGALLEDDRCANKTNDGIHYCEYMYMEYCEEKIEQIGINEFKSDSYFPHPDSYASKKRFFEKHSQLPVNILIPITLQCGSTKFQCCHGLMPNLYKEQTFENGRRIR